MLVRIGGFYFFARRIWLVQAERVCFSQHPPVFIGGLMSDAFTPVYLYIYIYGLCIVYVGYRIACDPIQVLGRW